MDCFSAEMPKIICAGDPPKVLQYAFWKGCKHAYVYIYMCVEVCLVFFLPKNSKRGLVSFLLVLIVLNF